MADATAGFESDEMSYGKPRIGTISPRLGDPAGSLHVGGPLLSPRRHAMAVRELAAATVCPFRRIDGFACSLADFEQMCVWADAQGFAHELLHVVFRRWRHAHC